MIKTVTVQFESGGIPYSYLFDGEIKTGDHAVVKVPSGRHSSQESYKVVEVLSVKDGRGPKACKHIVDVVDTASYEQRLETEAKRQAIIAELNQRQKKLDEEQRFALLAKYDAGAAALLAELKALD